MCMAFQVGPKKGVSGAFGVELSRVSRRQGEQRCGSPEHLPAQRSPAHLVFWRSMISVMDEHGRVFRMCRIRSETRETTTTRTVN